jgi:hypothetical protein
LYAQTTQWPKEKAQKDKQRSTKHTYKTKDRVTRIPQQTFNISYRPLIEAGEIQATNRGYNSPQLGSLAKTCTRAYYIIIWVTIELNVHFYILFQINIYSDRSLADAI